MLITDIRAGELNLLTGHEQDTFELRALHGLVLAVVPTTQHWIHTGLADAVDTRQRLIEDVGSADFYVGSQFESTKV